MPKSTYMACYATLGHLSYIKSKNTCRGMLILDKVAGGSAASLKQSTPNDGNCPKSKARHSFKLLWFVFPKFPEN